MAKRYSAEPYARVQERDTDDVDDLWNMTQLSTQPPRSYRPHSTSFSPELVHPRFDESRPRSTSLLHSPPPKLNTGMNFRNDVLIFNRKAHQNELGKNSAIPRRDPKFHSTDREHADQTRTQSVPMAARARREVLESADSSIFLDDARNYELRQRFLREEANQRQLNSSPYRTYAGPSEKELFFREKYLFLKERAIFLRERQSFMIEKELFLMEKRDLLRRRAEAAPAQTKDTVRPQSLPSRSPKRERLACDPHPT
jgi:hypothetical protein